MVTRRRVVLAVNPAAAFGRRPGVGEHVEQRLVAAGHDVVRLTAGSAAELRFHVDGALADGADALVVVGGDGMVHLGVQALAGTDLPLGIVPTGTGNDTARGLGIAIDDVDVAVAQLVTALRGTGRRIDTGVVSADGREIRFVCVLSAGFDAVVNERANRMRRPRGASRYVIALLRELVTLGPLRYRMVLDGERLDVEGVLLAVANNGSLGGGMRIAPDAALDDGLFDVVLVRPVSRLRFLRLFPRVFSGTHLDVPEVDVHRAREVELDAHGVVMYADGERIGPLPARIRVDPASLTVLA